MKSPENLIAKLFENPKPIAQSRKRRRHQYSKSARIALAPDVGITTLPGSLYTTILIVLARLGELARHDEFFKKFKACPSGAGARKLFSQIGVLRWELDRHVRQDPDFKTHCRKRTMQYRAMAARGVKKYQALFKDRKIFNASGRWIGDIDEAIEILKGARTHGHGLIGKNVKILRRARLMFDASLFVKGHQICVLYRERDYRAFLQARNILCPPRMRKRAHA